MSWASVTSGSASAVAIVPFKSYAYWGWSSVPVELTFRQAEIEVAVRMRKFGWAFPQPFVHRGHTVYIVKTLLTVPWQRNHAALESSDDVVFVVLDSHQVENFMEWTRAAGFDVRRITAWTLILRSPRSRRAMFHRLKARIIE